MLCEKILGTLSDQTFAGLRVDYVDIEWHEAFPASTARPQPKARMSASGWGTRS